jgi:serine/threonine protein kinase
MSSVNSVSKRGNYHGGFRAVESGLQNAVLDPITLSFVDQSIELEYWRFFFQNPHSSVAYKVIFLLSIFSAVMSPLNTVIDLMIPNNSEWKVTAFVFGMKVTIIEAIFFATQSILFWACLRFIKGSLQSANVSMESFQRYFFFLHSVLIFTSLGTIYIACAQTQSDPDEPSEQVLLPIWGFDYILICITVFSAPLAGMRFGAMLLKSCADLFLLLLFLLNIDKKSTEPNTPLVIILFIALYIFSCFATRELEIVQRLRFIQTSILQSANIHAELQLNPFSAKNLRDWIITKSRDSNSDNNAEPLVRLLSHDEVLDHSDRPKQKSVSSASEGSQSTLAMWDIDFNVLSLGEKVAAGGGGLIRKGEYGNQPVAIKQLFGAVLTNPKDLKVFANEVKMLATLGNFPSVVRMFGISQHRGAVFLVMEWCESTLASIIVREKWPDPELLHRSPAACEFVLRVAQQLCAAMCFLHDNGIVHLDLKPANVLVHAPFPGYAENQETPLINIKLCDFGLSKSDEAATSIKIKGGTPLYMAPEILPLSSVYGNTESIESMPASFTMVDGSTDLNSSRHPGQVTAPSRRRYGHMSFAQLQKVDVYAFGVVLYAMLHNNRVYDDEFPNYDSPEEFLRTIRRGLRPSIR